MCILYLIHWLMEVLLLVLMFVILKSQYNLKIAKYYKGWALTYTTNGVNHTKWLWKFKVPTIKIEDNKEESKSDSNDSV